MVAFPRLTQNAASATCTTVEVTFATAGRPISSVTVQRTRPIPPSAVTVPLFYKKEGLSLSAVAKKATIPIRTSAFRERSLLNAETAVTDSDLTCAALDTFSLVPVGITLDAARLKATTAPSISVSVARYTRAVEATNTIQRPSSAVETCLLPVMVA